MGMFKGKSYFIDDVEYAFMICWGELTRDPKVECVNKTKVEFGMKYYRKTFMNCIHWGEDDTSEIMATLERGDKVICFGTWSKKAFTNKKGEVKDWSELNCEIVIPMSAVTSVIELASSPSIRKLLDNDKSDKFEGDYDDDDSDNDFSVDEDYDDDDFYGGSII